MQHLKWCCSEYEAVPDSWLKFDSWYFIIRKRFPVKLWPHPYSQIWTAREYIDVVHDRLPGPCIAEHPKSEFHIFSDFTRGLNEFCISTARELFLIMKWTPAKFQIAPTWYIQMVLIFSEFRLHTFNYLPLLFSQRFLNSTCGLTCCYFKTLQALINKLYRIVCFRTVQDS